MGQALRLSLPGPPLFSADSTRLPKLLPQTLSSNADPRDTPARAVRSWQVLHACEPVAGLHPLIAGELALGMRPMLVTRDGLLNPDALLGSLQRDYASISLLTAWHDVRHWRKALMDSDPALESDIVHSHSFTAGMAGVRNFPAVVYDVNCWIEDHAGDFKDSEHSWLARSFRVAEQFVLARAAAVVTRCQSMRDAAIRRGTSPENVFVIPSALEEREPHRRDQHWMDSLGISSPRSIVLYAPDHRIEMDSGGKLSASAENLIAAFATVCSEVEKCYLLVDVDAAAESALRESKDAYHLGDAIKGLAREDRSRAFAACDLVIAGRYQQFGSSSAPNPSSIEAFAARRALLAADLLCNRDLSPNGRGCIWYAEDDARDLAHRAAFLARNAEFRRALADAGHGFYLETRTEIAVAQQYDAVYRHAYARRKSGNLQTPATRLLPVHGTF